MMIRMRWYSLLMSLALPLLATMMTGCKRPKPTAGSSPLPTITTKMGRQMVLIPAGWFTMGSDKKDEPDERSHRVYVSAFYIDTHLVTQADYEKVMGTNPSRWRGDTNPVEQIRWFQAVEYCNARSRLEGLEPAYTPKTWECRFEANGYRLPTEAEWEYAARAGTSTAYCFGDAPSLLGDYAWFRDNAFQGTHPVGKKLPNAWGLFDMHGNVWQWCNDLYQEDYYAQSPEKDPRGPSKGGARVLRGGCWNSRADKCRSAYRNNENPGYTDACFARDISGAVGFRCVRRPAGDAATIAAAGSAGN